MVLGVAIGGSALWALPGSRVAGHQRQFLLAAAIVLVIGVIIAGTLFTVGSASLWDNLLQMHTRPGEPLSFGSHWRYHFLSRLMLMLVSFGMLVWLFWVCGADLGQVAEWVSGSLTVFWFCSQR